MIRFADKLTLTLALVTLFAAGTGTGYFLGKKSASIPALVPTQPAGSQTATTDWWDRALTRLSDDLKLSESQKNSVRPLLQHAANQMFLNRDRALFQIHLELLAFHDSLGRNPSLLDPAQKTRLGGLRARLRQRIETDFPQFLKDSPLPVVTAFSGF